MYGYYHYINKSKIDKTKNAVIYGAGKAGLKLEEEFRDSKYKVEFFCDDDKIIQSRSIDGIKILSPRKLKEKLIDKKFDLLLIAMPSASSEDTKKIYNDFNQYFKDIKILPSLNEILQNKDFKTQLKDISVEDLLARYPKDLDKTAIKEFIRDKTILVTGAGGSIGSEIVRQCKIFGAKQIIALDHSEYNLYAIEQEIDDKMLVPIMQSVINIDDLKKTFSKYSPDIVIHAAAYKHVPLCEANIDEAVKNNILGSKNIIDISCEYSVSKVVMISTDKAVRPTNVMGTTKRICELYAQNKQNEVSLENNSKNTIISAVRFGNVLGSSGSIIPKFKKLINEGKNLTVTHPDITRYFMLIPEACELVLQAGALGEGGEIFILDMGEEIKIVDLAKKMIELSGKDDIEIEFTGLRPGEKLYEELLIDDSDANTKYESITVAKPTKYDINQLTLDIEELLNTEDKLAQLKKIVPEFEHKLNK
jgi:FlaA1/EpsC-like NDP-sugar epimerase